MDESSPNPASPSRSAKKRNKHNKDNEIPPFPTASSSSLTRENFGPASSISQQRQIVRLEGEATIEDLERENAALLKSQHSLFLMNTKQKRTLDTLEAEHQSITKREAEAQFHIAALQMELQTLAERLGSSAIGGENIPNQNTTSEQTPLPPQQEESTPGSFRYSEIMNRLEAKNNNFNVSESPNGQQQQSQSGATSLNFNHTNYQQGANRGALFELSTSGTTTARTTMTTQNNQQHQLSSLNLKNMYIPGAHVEWGEQEGEGYFEKHQIDKSNNRKSLNSNFFSSSSTNNSPESNLSPVIVHAPRGSEQHQQQVTTTTTTNKNAAAVVAASTNSNTQHDSPSPKNNNNNNNNASSSSPAQALENSRAFLMKSQTPEQFGGRLWEQCEDVWRLKAELQVVWESRRRFDQLLKAALVRLRDAETEIDENNTVVLPGFKKRIEDDRDERLRLEEEVDHAHNKIKSLEQELKSALRQIQQQQLQIDQMVVAARQQQQHEKIITETNANNNNNNNNNKASPLRSHINSSFADEEQESKNNIQQQQQQTNYTTTNVTTNVTRGEKIDLDENDKFLRTTSVQNNNALSPAPYDSSYSAGGTMGALAVVHRATSLMQLQLLDLHATTNTISPSRTYGGTNVGDIRDLRRLERELALSKKREAMWKLRHDQLFAQLERGTELLLDRYADPLKYASSGGGGGSSSQFFCYASSPSNSRFLDDVYNTHQNNNNYGGSLSPRSRGGFLTYSSIGSPFLTRTNNVNLNNATRTARFSPESGGRRSQPQQQHGQQGDGRSQSIRSNNANSVSPGGNQEKDEKNNKNNNNNADERSPEPTVERIDQE